MGDMGVARPIYWPAITAALILDFTGQPLPRAWYRAPRMHPRSTAERAPAKRMHRQSPRTHSPPTQPRQTNRQAY